jgi:hypothetical protein
LKSLELPQPIHQLACEAPVEVKKRNLVVNEQDLANKFPLADNGGDAIEFQRKDLFLYSRRNRLWEELQKYVFAGIIDCAGISAFNPLQHTGA